MIRTRDLRKAFGRHEFLRGIDLKIAPGEVVGLIGANGAGKTTLLSCILGFLNLSGGSVEIDGGRNDDLRVDRSDGDDGSNQRDAPSTLIAIAVILLALRFVWYLLSQSAMP